MERPTWATVMGVFMLLIGGCGGMMGVGDIKAKEIIELKNEAFDEIDKEVIRKNKDIKADSQSDNTIPAQDTSAIKILTSYGDSLHRDSTGQPDIIASLKSMTKMSDYRIDWMKKFGYVSLIMGLLFIVSGIFFFRRSPITIQLGIFTLVMGIAFSVFKLFVYKADVGTSSLIGQSENFKIYVAIFMYVLVLIVLMVAGDKEYYLENREV